MRLGPPHRSGRRTKRATRCLPIWQWLARPQRASQQLCGVRMGVRRSALSARRWQPRLGTHPRHREWRRRLQPRRSSAVHLWAVSAQTAATPRQQLLALRVEYRRRACLTRSAFWLTRYERHLILPPNFDSHAGTCSACRVRCLDRSAVDTGTELESPSGAPPGYDCGSRKGTRPARQVDWRAPAERAAHSGERVATRVARVSVARTTSVRMRPSARRPVRGMCLEFCRALGRCRCVRASARAMVCGALHAAVVAAIEVARRAIAPYERARAPTGAYARPGCHVGYC